MTGAQPHACIAVKIFVKENQVAPVLVMLVNGIGSMRRTPSIFITQKEACKPAGYLRRDFPECQHLSGASRTFHPIVVAQIVMKLLQRFDQQKIDREPDRPPPV